jgi:hypothetical protein
MPKHAAAQQQAHGLVAVLPGFHRCEVRTFSDDDAETIASMLRHAGCETLPLFDYTPTTNGAFSR